MSELWRVELHCHSRFSFDSLARPEAIIAAAQRRRLDRLAITDHNTIAGALAAQSQTPDLILVGEEIKTLQGEVIAWFVTEEIPKGLPLVETMDRLAAQGAVVAAPHPLDSLRGGSALGRAATLSIIHRLDALEVFNSRCLRPADNAAARELAQAYGKLMTVGSDAHTVREIGTSVMLMPPFHDAASFRSSLTHARTETHLSGGHVRLASTFARFFKKLFPSV